MEDLRYILFILLVIFGVWMFTGGPDRAENKFNPFIKPANPIDSGEVYGAYDPELAEYLQENEWQVLYTNNFSIAIDDDCEIVPDEYDSDVGHIVCPDFDLRYTYGFFSNPLSYDDDFRYIVTYEELGRETGRFVRPRTENALITGVYIEKSNRRSLTVYQSNLTDEQQAEAFVIFRTLRLE